MAYGKLSLSVVAFSLLLALYSQPLFAIDFRAEMSLVKTVDQNEVTEGTSVTYYFTVTNTGNITLSSVSVSDLKCSPIIFDRFSVGNNDSELEPGEVWVYKCSAVIEKTTVNTATASAEASFLESTIDSKPSSVTVSVIVPTAVPTNTPTVTPTPVITPTATSTPTITPTAIVTLEPKATTPPIPCQKINNLPAQLALDGAASSINAVAARMSKKIVKLSQISKNRRFARAAAAQSNALYIAIWEETWKRISAEASQCSADASQLALCVKTSFVAQKALVNSHMEEINQLILRMAASFKQEFPGRVAYANHLVRSAARFKGMSASMLQSVPDESVSCS